MARPHLRRTHNSTHTRGAPVRSPWQTDADRQTAAGRAARSAAEALPVPAGRVRCRCGRIVRVRGDGLPAAHNHCPFAVPTTPNPSICSVCGEGRRDCARAGRCGDCGCRIRRGRA